MPDLENPKEEEVFVFPASFAQQRLWFLDRLVPGNSFYNVPYLVRLVGKLNLAALEQTFNEIVHRHETLRTSFRLIEGQIVQVISPTSSLPLPVVDLQNLPASERDRAAHRLATAEFERPFDLSGGLLLRSILFKLADTEHLLLLCMHHIICDDWSLGVLIRELGALYTAFTLGQPSQEPSLPLQYADFALWQREWLQGEVLETQLAYWRQQLQGISLLNLPSDRPLPATPSYRGATEFFQLPKQLTEALKALSQQQGVTLYMTLLAAFKTLLYRYTHQEDIAVGSPIANRNRREIEGLIGFFVNTLVLRTDLSGNPTFLQLLDRVREVTIGAYSHQDLPFEKLVESFPERNKSHHPLFQVIFNLQNAPMSQLELPGLALSSVDFVTKTTRFDLEFHLWECSDNFRSLVGNGWEQEEGMRGVVVYSTDLFSPATITRMLRHFLILLEGIVANPFGHLWELPILTASERQQLLHDWNHSATDLVTDKAQGIITLFEDWVERTPDAIAVSFENQQLTYRELSNRSNQLAHYLQKLGVGAEVLVGICLERSVEMIVGILGILKAGGAYLPLDPSYPFDRLKFMIEDARVSVLLTEERCSDASRLREHLENICSQVVLLDNDWETIAQQAEDKSLLPVNGIKVGGWGNNLAYVIYTSGSTGKPKGVAITHSAATQLVCNSNYMQLKPDDKVAQVANFSFDAAVFEIWGALLNGAQLVIISRNITLSPEQFALEISRQGISILFLTTALFQQLASFLPNAFDCLRSLLFGGESVETKWVEKVFERQQNKELLYFYGPSENTTFSSWYKVQYENIQSLSSLPIGRPIKNTQIYLLDRHLQPVPIGVTGELFISGHGLARGYLNRPDLTAERFIPNPFSQDPGSRLYQTGDLARYRVDGNIEFLGRIDEQVKIRGFRIELGEIEAVLLEHPAVRETVVIAREDVPGNKHLVAYIVSSSPSPSPSWRSFLKEKLPEYMLPSAYVTLESLPLTPNGKIDHRALPGIDTVSSQIGEDYLAPSNPIEEVLVGVWTELLGRQQIGVRDNFFELGGHSLLATQLCSRIRDVFQVELPLSNFFEAPTVADVANYIETIYWATKRVHTNDSRMDLREDVEL